MLKLDYRVRNSFRRLWSATKDVVLGKDEGHVVKVMQVNWTSTVDHKDRPIQYRRVRAWFGRKRVFYRERFITDAIEIKYGAHKLAPTTILNFSSIQAYVAIMTGGDVGSRFMLSQMREMHDPIIKNIGE